MSFPIKTSAANVPIVPPQGQPHGGGGSVVLSDISKIRDLAEQIRQRCAHVQLAGQQQTTSFQVSQAEELTKRLKEVTERLQAAVKESLADIQEQLDLVSSRLGLKFETRHSAQEQARSFFIIGDAFFTEVCCQSNGHVNSVRLVQASHQEEEEVLCQLLRGHKYSQFECHLQALTDFYKQASSPTDYSNMHRVLSAIEKEVVVICEKSPQQALNEMIMSNPLGHVTPRKGGLPQYLTIFVHPYEVLKNPFLSKPPGSVVGGVANSSRQEVDLDLGVAVKMMMEKSYQVNRLSIIPNLFNFNKAQFCQLTDQNSVLLSLNFTLELSVPVPTCGLVLERLHETVFAKAGTEQRVVPTGRHVNQLVAHVKATKENKETFSEKSRVVCLPGQRHYYFMPTELKSSDVSHDTNYPASVCGIMLSKVMFCHPVHLFSIIPLLQKQLVYNTLLDSCLGRSAVGIPPSSEGLEFIFELTTMPPDQIVVTMDTQTTSADSRIIVEFIVPDQQPTKLLVQVKVGAVAPLKQPQLSEIITRCLSIPVTLHAALRHPVQLLGANAAAALKAYNKSIEEFNRELGTMVKPEVEGPSFSGVVSTVDDVETHVSYLGMKRKRID